MCVTLPPLFATRSYSRVVGVAVMRPWAPPVPVARQVLLLSLVQLLPENVDVTPGTPPLPSVVWTVPHGWSKD